MVGFEPAVHLVKCYEDCHLRPLGQPSLPVKIALCLNTYTVLIIIYIFDEIVTNCMLVHNLALCYTANILTVLSTAFGSVTFPTVIWLHILQPNIALSLKLYSSKSVTVMCTANGCDNPSQITVGNVTQQMAVNWLWIFAV